MSYYPDMSSQAAAQGFFDDLLRRTIAASPLFQRYAGGSAVYADFGALSVPAASGGTPGQAGAPVNLGGRGIIAAFATWTTFSVMSNPPRVAVAGANLTIFNDTALVVSCYWLALAL